MNERPRIYRVLVILAVVCVTAMVAFASGCDRDDAVNSTGRVLRIEDVDGQQLFVRKCAHCHGTRGRGDGPGAVSYSRVADLSDPELQQRISDLQMGAIIEDGTGRMPPVRGLQQVEVDALVAFVRSLAKDPAAP